MTRSLSLAAYLALHRGVERKNFAATAPARPDGQVIWVRGQRPDHGPIGRMLATAFRKDGDDATFLITGTKETTGDPGTKVLFEPNPEETVAGHRAFLKHWKPDALVWLGGGLDPITLVETDNLKIPRIFANATGEAVSSTVGTWVPGMTTRLLERFDTIIATEAKAKNRLIKQGAIADQIDVLGTLEESLPLLPYSEHERQSLAQAMGPRPVWLAVESTPAELGLLATAHKYASRRTHRLLFVLVPKSPSSGPETAQRLRDLGFDVALRSHAEEPEDATQIYVADTVGELGLWYRIAPICYFGGTLIEGDSRHPFEAAALGSAIVHGPLTGGQSAAFARLDAAEACRPIKTADDLGPAIEALLSPDKAAQLANAAWTATSAGAEACNRVIALLQAALDRKGP